jgi:hypothetical protein
MTYSKIRRKTMPIPVEPAVLGVALVQVNGTVDVPVYIPWESCRLVYAYTVTTVAEGNDAAVGIDLELNAASGSAIGTITVTQNAAVGDLHEIGTITEANAENLSALDSARDAINAEITGTVSGGTWQGMLYLYFEPWEGE